MSLALKGVPSKLVAKRLDLSRRTVEHSRSRLLERLGATSTVELMHLMREEASYKSNAAA